MLNGAVKPVVYFVQGATSSLVKIGCSMNFRNRFQQLKYHALEELSCLGTHSVDDALFRRHPGRFLRLVERNFHKEFARDRVKGEWFKPSEKLYETIRRLCA